MPSIIFLINMPSFQIPYEPLIYPNWQFPTQSFTLIDIILIYNLDFKAPRLLIKVATFLLINELMYIPAYMPTPTHFFIDFTKKDSLIGSLYSEYQFPPPETLGESLFGGGSVKYINLSIKEEEIVISLDNYFILKSLLLNPPPIKRVYIDLIINNLKTITYFQHLFFWAS